MPVIPTRTATVRKAWKRLFRKQVLPTFHMSRGSTDGSRSGGWSKRGFFVGGSQRASALAACVAAGASGFFPRLLSGTEAVDGLPLAEGGLDGSEVTALEAVVAARERPSCCRKR